MIREKAHGRDTFRLGPVLETLLRLKIIKKKKKEGRELKSQKGKEKKKMYKVKGLLNPSQIVDRAVT